MSERITVNPGPPILLDHQDPHFNPAGDCICGCPACSTDLARYGRFVEQQCICPACPCDGGA